MQIYNNKFIVVIFILFYESKGYKKPFFIKNCFFWLLLQRKDNGSEGYTEHLRTASWG